MILFKQVRAVSRDDTLHTCLRMVCTEKKRSFVSTKSEPWESLSLLFLLAVRRIRREHIRTMSKNADDRCSLEALSTVSSLLHHYLYCALFEKM